MQYGTYVEFLVSMKRIQDFLLAEDINQSIIKKAVEQKSEQEDSKIEKFSFEFKNNSHFYWSLAKE